MAKALIFLLLFTGCSEWYLVKSVEIRPSDIPALASVMDSTRPLETIRQFQENTRYNWTDFGYGFAYATLEGAGLGLYESKIYYSPKAFPGMKDTWFYDWVNMPTGGDQWMKIGHPDKVGRAFWITFTKAGWNRWLRFYGGNWVFTYLTQFTISNTIAEVIRQQAKYGTFTLSFELDWRFIDIFLE